MKSAIDMIERCVRAQPEQASFHALFIDTVDMKHEPHPETVGPGYWMQSGFEDLAPNLVLWTGYAHKAVLALKEDQASR